MLSGGRGIDGLDRLDVRLVALLGLALLPIGLIAMVQTYRVIDNANAVAREALIGATTRAVDAEREILTRLRGAAQTTAAIIPDLLSDPANCSAHVRRIAAQFPQLAFAGYIDSDGIVQCATQDVGADVSDRPIYKRLIEERRSFFSATVGVISERPVIVVVQPVESGSEEAGYIALSVPQSPLRLTHLSNTTMQPLATVTVSADGTILSSSSKDVESLVRNLAPATGGFRALISNTPQDYEDQTASGTDAIYSVVPIIPNEIYGISVWRAASVATGGLTAASAILFPLLMWAVSIGVAYFAVHRLVVRHIRKLRQRMRAFTTTRRILPPTPTGDLPSELREVVEAFEQLTERIVRDEADLENSLHEKDVLLKEVHHRVKNNLQLISSMLNMQMRKADSQETRELLHRLQDRILGLATIHRNLYRADVLSRVGTDQLIQDLVAQIVDPGALKSQGIKLDVDVAPVALYPDQAVPLSLLITEALTNALKYVGRPETGAPWVSIELIEDGGVVTLTCANSVGQRISEMRDQLASGLGTQLMQAFVMQLDGTLTHETTDSEFAIKLQFRTSEFGQEL